MVSCKAPQASRFSQEAARDYRRTPPSVNPLDPAPGALAHPPMDECERLSGLSHDTLAREHSDKIKRLSKHRNGMRVLDALMLSEADVT